MEIQSPKSQDMEKYAYETLRRRACPWCSEPSDRPENIKDTHEIIEKARKNPSGLFRLFQQFHLFSGKVDAFRLILQEIPQFPVNSHKFAERQFR